LKVSNFLSVYGILSTGQIAHTAVINNPDGTVYFDNFTYSCADTSLYGLVRTNYYSQVFDSATVHLGKLDAMTGEVTKVSKEFTLETSQLIHGIYFLHITHPKGKEIVKILK
jgi:hypothetical protein